METLELETLRYPVGKFSFPAELNSNERNEMLEIIATLPTKMRDALQGLSDKQLDTPYREGGWTIRQVVHHVFDSHVNAYIRMKLTVTEDVPVIKPYDQDKWSQLADARMAPVEISLSLIEGIHTRWMIFLHSLKEDDYKLCFFHPEHKRKISLDQTLALYAWHCRHHLAHITELRKRMMW
jgi:hypothetical protein